MKILLLGGGGREHAIARSLSRDPQLSELHIAPGNPGIAALGTCHDVDPADPAAVVALATALKIDLVVVGPEAPLVAGVADAVRAAGIDCFGPDAAAAQLEASKAFAKQIMEAAKVPTAAARLCQTREQIEAALDEFGPTYVVKNDGLAAGKGVVVTDDRDQALAHGLACGKVVIEEYLDGPEVSLFVICDGKQGFPLLPAQDYKRVGDGDTGPNTGGMGAYCPLDWLSPELVPDTMIGVVNPVLAEMNKRGMPFVGLLYVGLALTETGLKVVEFNVRFGDPETQAVLALLETPLAGLLQTAARGELASVEGLQWRSGNAVVVVAAADGYPEEAVLGSSITLPADDEAAYVLQAGTAVQDGQLVSAGGRVLGVVGCGEDIDEARDRAYAKLAEIDFDNAFARGDIGIPH